MIIRWCKGVHGQGQGRKRQHKIVNSKIAEALHDWAEGQVNRANGNSETVRNTCARRAFIDEAVKPKLDEIRQRWPGW
jgi:hypothetical protein